MNTPDPVSRPYLYRYPAPDPAHTGAYLWDPILTRCKQFGVRRILDLGCGDGALCEELVRAGFQTVGCDPSDLGIQIATQAIPNATFKQLSVYDDPASLGEGDFDTVISTEVIEHLFFPRHLPRFAFQVLRPGGHLILSTPYHGYLKNLILSLGDKWDSHFTPFRDGGHIKLWSRRTITKLLEEEGFRVTHFIGAGRFPFLWKSMILVAEKRSDAGSQRATL